jgi:hypothetical protein
MSDINELIERLEKAALVLYQTSQTADSKEEFMEWEAAQALRLLNDENERLRAVYEAAIAVNNTCQIESCKSPVGDEPLKLEQAIAAAQEGSDE